MKKASEYYSELDGNRSSILDRAKEASELTIPYVFRDVTEGENDALKTNTVQSYGAKIVNHLVGKFALSILPPSHTFFRLSPTEEALQAITDGNDEMKNEIEKILATKEEGILRYINNSKFRSALYRALKTSMITGDALIERVEVEGQKTYIVHNMNKYVIKRDYSGNILRLVIKETKNYKALPDDLRKGETEDSEVDTEDKDIYTHLWLEDGKYKMNQEIDGEVISGTERDLKNFNDAFISLRWNKLDGEDYGRGFVEDHIGTLRSLNKLMKVINETSAISSKVVYTVNPNGMTKLKDFHSAKHGGVISGKPEDIGVIQTNKANDLQMTYSLINDYKKELAEAFLMVGASIRDSERTTKFEVQQITQELDASFGGQYTGIAEDVQVPLIKNAMSELGIKLDKDVDVVITAGVEALGRSIELSKINSMVQELMMLAQLVGQEQIAMAVNVNNITSAIVANSGVASKGFLYSGKEIEEKQIAQKQDAIAQQMMQGALPQAGMNMANQATGVQG